MDYFTHYSNSWWLTVFISSFRAAIYCRVHAAAIRFGLPANCDLRRRPAELAPFCVMHICAAHAAFISPRSKKSAPLKSRPVWPQRSGGSRGSSSSGARKPRYFDSFFCEKLAHIFSKHFLLSSLHFNRILTSELWTLPLPRYYPGSPRV